VSRLKLAFVGVMLLSQVLLACSTPAASPTAAPPPPTTAPVPTATTAPVPTATTAPAATATSATSAATNGPIVQIVKDAKLGDLLTGPNGKTLYLYTKDAPDTSNCSGGCAAAWPPLTTTSDPTGPAGLPGKLGTTIRADGTKQVTYNSMPLYYYAKDQKPGDTTGQEVGYVWFAVPPTMAGFPTVKAAKDAKLGEILTDQKGMTLYRFTKDAPDTSNCYDACAQAWPPVLVKAGDPIGPLGLDGKLGVTTRKDGAKQVTYNGVPLYYYAKDQKPGDTTGQNVGNVWFIVPEGT
jgi:predicted lipoprotein with Yx(FWY)xxD motif